MKQDMKQRWVEALRSGDYKQGKNKMYRSTDDSYCCLGVLNKVEKLEAPNSGSFSFPILEEIGLSPNEQEYLISMNDDHEYSFDQIAFYIERNV